MHSQIQKWGNSLGLRIPSQIAKKLNLHEGVSINLEVENGQLILKTNKYTLENLLDQITPENQHNVVLDNVQLRGKEEW